MKKVPPTRPQDFVYDLPPDRIAQRPAAKRDTCRLMVLDRLTGRATDRFFSDLPHVLRPGDLLVLNDTRVIPAKFEARRASGGRVEGLFLRRGEAGTWSVLLGGAGRCSPGEALSLGPGQSLVLQERGERGQWAVRPDPPGEVEAILDRFGVTPLPPYIHRPGPMGDREDRAAYQTVYARAPGAVAAPTAGMHFTDALLSALAERGIGHTSVTLHVGYGTFAPVEVDSLADHRMHAEWYDWPAGAVAAVTEPRRRGGRVVAVGTTAVRVLESAARRRGPLRPHRGWPELFLYPPAAFALPDALLPNFHLPASTLVMLVAAFCRPGEAAGTAVILDAYRQAVERGYRFYSYGDAMLIE